MTCGKCGCCEAYVCDAGTSHEEQWDMCLWCADGVPCPNAVEKTRRTTAAKMAAAIDPPRHDEGVMHFASASKVSRTYLTSEVQRARSIPTPTSNGEDMPKNNIEELRSDLFDTLRSLKGEVKPIDIQRASAVVAVAGKIIDTGKLEIALMKKLEQPLRTGFFTGNIPAPALAPPPEKKRLTNGKAH
jgi:hypothetical protein